MHIDIAVLNEVLYQMVELLKVFMSKYQDGMFHYARTFVYIGWT